MTMPLSILLVDDEPDILSSMGRILRREGYTVDTATSIAAATSRGNLKDYFAVLLDRKLPDGMTDEFVPKLKLLAPQAAIIVITAYADLESSLASLRNGVEDYLLKPIEPQAVLHRLRRVHDMQQAELRAHQAERLSAIGEMMTAIAHESRNALQRIQAGVDMLSFEIPKQSEARKDLRCIERAREDLQRMFEELRSYAAPIKLDMSKCGLAGVWRQAWSHLRTAQAGGNAELHEETNGVDLTCPVDAFRIEQVFRNLMENSLAACGDAARVEIKCHESSLNGEPAVCVSVRDNGPGLSAEQKDRMFEAFFTTKSSGTGLGMAIAERIIDAHQGTIRVGDHDDGAEFVITLPRILDDQSHANRHR
jgi:signal transduction histidine kinase